MGLLAHVVEQSRKTKHRTGQLFRPIPCIVTNRLWAISYAG